MYSSPTVSQNIITALCDMANSRDADILSRFFKTGTGEYGAGDKFLGVRVPRTRGIVRNNIQNATLDDVDILTSSDYHEIRLAGFFVLEYLYKRSIKEKDISHARELVDYYLEIIDRGNNWDLVDLVCYKILGDAIVHKIVDLEKLYVLAKGGLWQQRVSIVSTMAILRSGDILPTIGVISVLLQHPHSLIQKANGWLLREAAKRDKDTIVKFIKTNINVMPRVTLRYAIERFSIEEKKFFMSM